MAMQEWLRVSETKDCFHILQVIKLNSNLHYNLRIVNAFMDNIYLVIDDILQIFIL